MIAPSARGGRVGPAQRRLNEQGLPHVEEHVCPGRDQLLVGNGLDDFVIKRVPVSVGRISAESRVVAPTHAPLMVADSKEVVDVVETGLFKAGRTSVVVSRTPGANVVSKHGSCSPSVVVGGTVWTLTLAQGGVGSGVHRMPKRTWCTPCA